MHGDRAAPANDDPHEVRHRRANRHEVDDSHSARFGLEVSLENQRVGPVTT
jgi:hypothetical protein